MAEQDTITRLVEHWRWAAEEGRGGADAYIRVRDAAQKDAYGRAAGEAERVAGEGTAAALQRLAAALRERSLNGWLPEDVKLPQWPARRPAPALDPAKVRREQQIGFSLALATCAAQLLEATGGDA